MKLGAVFPQAEIGTAPAAIRRFAQTVESLGYDFLAVYDHVLGADPNRPGWSGVYNYEHQFHEIFVLFGYLAACTERLELVSRVLVSPQRQTALIAKQTAEIAVLAEGRLRLGLGVGWNDVEYEALGCNFHDRGRREEEQIEVLRRLWAEDLVSFDGTHHTIGRAGINPRPPGGTIPIWLGGRADVLLRRAGRMADGWMPTQMDEAEIDDTVNRLRGYVSDAGRDPSTFGLDPSVRIDPDGLDRTLRSMERWRAVGATHFTVNTINHGLGSGDDQLEVLRRFREKA